MNEVTTTGGGAPAVHRSTFKPLKECETLEEAFKTKEFMDRIQASVPQHVQPQRMLRTFVTAVSKAPLLAKASLRSFVGACLTLSQVGLEPNTPLGNAHLIPFKVNKKVNGQWETTYDINVIFGYPGLLDLSFRSRLVKAVHADVVWPGDDFSFEYGSNAHVRHKPMGMPREDNVRPTHAYMHAVLADGQAFEVMPYHEVLRIRDRSQAYRAALALKEEAEGKAQRIPKGFTEAPWVAHEIAMARKTAFRSGSKWLPRSIELTSAIAIDESADRRRTMDFSAVLDAPTIDGKHDYLSVAADAALASDDDPPYQPDSSDGATFADRRPTDREEVNRQIDDETARAAEAKRNRDTELQKQKLAEDEDRRRRHALAKEQAELEARARKNREDAEVKRKADATIAREQADADARAAIHRQAAAKQDAASFEAVIVAADGEPMDAVYVDPIQFARAYMMLWREAHEAEDADAVDALETFNADALGDAYGFEHAATILAERNADRSVGQNVGPDLSIVVPPDDRGKLNWKLYVEAIRSRMVQIPMEPAPFRTWMEAQRPNLEVCPPAQRALCARAIVEQCGVRQVPVPPWFADLVRKRGQPAAAETGGVDPGTNNDERWVNDLIAELANITDRPRFEQLSGAMAVKTVMARLRRENEALFARADDAFAAKIQELGPPPEA